MRRYLSCLFIILPLLSGAAVPADAAENPPPDQAQPRYAQTDPSGGGMEMRLKTNKILVTHRAYRQIFEPYLHPQGPIFVTTDAVLTGYNTLMTESLRRFERINAQKLPEILSAIWSRLSGDKKTAEKSEKDAAGSAATDSDHTAGETLQQIVDVRKKARQYARFVVAVALKLLGRDPAGLDAELQPAVEEIHRDIAAGRHLPGPRISAGIFDAADFDPGRFRPHGFYRQSEDLQRYFRALRWLRTARFRIENDEELLAILTLGKVVAAANVDKSMQPRMVENYFRRYRELTGRRTDRDVLLAAQIVRDRPADLTVVREYLARITAEEHRIDIGDAQRPPSNKATLSTGEAFTVISSGHRSERLLFEIISAETVASADGIAICGALGSNYARREWTRRLSPGARDRRLSILAQVKLFLPDIGLYDQYLSCLASLTDAVEPDAPLFMFTDAWEIKSCNAVLSGWVQAQRVPQPPIRPDEGRGTEFYGALPEGFVEPEPEFFARLGGLVERSREILERCAVFVPPREVIAADLRGFVRLIEQGRYPPQNGPSGDFLPDVQASVDRSRKVLTVLGNLEMPAPADAMGTETIERISALAEDIEKGRYDDDPAYQGVIIETNVDLNQIWKILGRLCRRLEVMAHKQLRGVAFNEKESYFLADFGIRLATVMLQGGGGSAPLRDDFPLLVPIPGTESEDYLHSAAIGRPRELLVLYPVQGREVLCQGAVVPYYETQLSQPLSEAEWIRRLDSDERPAEPRWRKPIVAPGPIEKAWQP